MAELLKILSILLSAVLAMVDFLVKVIAISVIVSIFTDSRPSPAETQKVSSEMLRELPKPMYFMDTRTKVCFAYFYQARLRWFQAPTGGPALTAVPCTLEVLENLENKDSALSPSE